MTRSSLYDVQKKAEEGGEPPPPPPPPPPQQQQQQQQQQHQQQQQQQPPSRACLSGLLAACVLIMVTLAVTLVVLLATGLAGPFTLPLGTTVEKVRSTVLTASPKTTRKPASSWTNEDIMVATTPSDHKANHAEKGGAAVDTTNAPAQSTIPATSLKAPVTKVSFDVSEVTYFHATPKKSSEDDSGEAQLAIVTRIAPEETNNTMQPIYAPATNQAASSLPQKPNPQPAGKPTEVKPAKNQDNRVKTGEGDLFSRVLPVFNEMVSDAGKGISSFVRLLFPESKGKDANEPTIIQRFGRASKLTPQPQGREHSGPYSTSDAVTSAIPSPELRSLAPGSAVVRAWHAGDFGGRRFRRFVGQVPTWDFGAGGGTYSSSSSSAARAVTRSWSVKDVTRDGETQRTETDTGPVELPERRTSSRTRLVFDAAAGWRPAIAPPVFAGGTDTRAPSVFGSGTDPRAPSVFGSGTGPRIPPVFGGPAFAVSEGLRQGVGAPYIGPVFGRTGGGAGDVSSIVAATRRRLEEVKRRMSQFRRNMPGYNFNRWG